MEITVLLFAGLAEKVGARQLTLPHKAGDTVAAVRDRLLAKHPEIEPFVPTLLYAVDEEYADEDTLVRGGATVAFIPPVSGG